MNHGFPGRYRLVWLTAALPVLLTGCFNPHVVSHELGAQCEAQGFKVGTDGYANCAAELKERGGAGGAPTVTTAGASPTRQVCDKSQPTDTPTSRYMFNVGLAYDTKTNLTWQRCSAGQNWNAKSGCVGLPIIVTWEKALTGAKEGWRLPTLDELMTLTSPNCKFPSINQEAFPGMDPEMLGGIGAHTQATPARDAIWGVDFRDGKASTVDRYSGSGTIRLVYSGK